MKSLRNSWLPKVLSVLLAFAASGIVIFGSRQAEAQGRAAILAPQFVIDNIAPSLIRSAPLKLTPEVSVSTRAKIEEQLFLRDRQVDIDFSVLQTIANNMAITGQAQRIRIPFFDDAEFPLEITNISATSSGGQVFTGNVLGTLHSSVVLVNNGGVVSLNVSALSERYAIHGSAESGFTAIELKRNDLPDHTSPPILVKLQTSPKPTIQTAADVALTAADTGPEVDVMVVYTPVVRVNNGGTAQMHANIDAQVALTNQIYAKSGVIQRLRLVYKGEVAYTETTDGTDLARLQNPGDGFMDSVPILRDIYKADFVSLWGNYPTTCGLGFLMDTENIDFADTAYNTVNSPGCTGSGSGTFAHELGHNMGLKHDNFEDKTAITNVTPAGSTVATNILYAHGYVDTTNRFRTVMAYDDECVAAGFSCERTLSFSNPSIAFDNRAFFAGANPNAPSGNEANANESRALNDTRETTRNFRTALPASAFTGPGIVVFPLSRYSVAEGGGSAQITVERHVGFTGAVSVNYATASGTATAGLDFTSTSGTLTWASGDSTARTITVPILQDTLLEGKETFTFTLSTPGGGVSIGALNGTSATVTVTIIDDEPDTFPIGGVMPTGYVTPATSAAAWTVDLTDGYFSNTSLQSAAVLSPGNDVYANSDLEYSATFLAGDVTFTYRVSSLSTTDANLQFMVDNVVVFNSAGGDTGWLTTSVRITAGAHTLRWRFRNQVDTPCRFFTSPVPPPNCADRAWIDSVVLPLPIVLANSTTNLGTSLNPSGPGQSVTLTAIVTGGSGTPTGTVAFLDGASPIAGCTAVPTSNGTAQCVTTGLLPGSHVITAQYAGNAAYQPSTSGALTQVVNVGVFPFIPLLILLL